MRRGSGVGEDKHAEENLNSAYLSTSDQTPPPLVKTRQVDETGSAGRKGDTEKEHRQGGTAQTRQSDTNTSTIKA